MPNVNKLKVLNAIYIVLCTCGLIWQFVEVSVQYFSFSTTTRISITYPSRFFFPALTICIRYSDILNYSMANSVGGHNWTNSQWDDIQTVQREIKINEIFNLTPSGVDLIESFYKRDKTGYAVEGYFGRDNLMSTLDITKFIYVEYMCYKIQLRDPMEIRPSVVSVHPVASGTFGHFFMSKEFRNVSQYKLSLHSNFTLPFESLMVQPLIRRNVLRPQTLNSVFVFPGYFTVENLKPPYKTRCIDYPQMNFQNQADCFQSCVINQTLKELSKYPYSAFIMNSSSKQLVSYKDADDPQTARQLDAIANQCEQSQKCKHNSCLSRTVITFTNFVDGTGEEFSIVMATPQRPWTYIRHEPSMSFVTFITYLMGAFGTWTGISIMYLSPFKWAMKKKNKVTILPRKDISLRPFNPMSNPHYLTSLK